MPFFQLGILYKFYFYEEFKYKKQTLHSDLKKFLLYDKKNIMARFCVLKKI